MGHVIRERRGRGPWRMSDAESDGSSSDNEHTVRRLDEKWILADGYLGPAGSGAKGSVSSAYLGCGIHDRATYRGNVSSGHRSSCKPFFGAGVDVPRLKCSPKGVPLPLPVSLGSRSHLCTDCCSGSDRDA